MTEGKSAPGRSLLAVLVHFVILVGPGVAQEAVTLNASQTFGVAHGRAGYPLQLACPWCDSHWEDALSYRRTARWFGLRTRGSAVAYVGGNAVLPAVTEADAGVYVSVSVKRDGTLMVTAPVQLELLAAAPLITACVPSCDDGTVHVELQTSRLIRVQAVAYPAGQASWWLNGSDVTARGRVADDGWYEFTFQTATQDGATNLTLVLNNSEGSAVHSWALCSGPRPAIETSNTSSWVAPAQGTAHLHVTLSSGALPMTFTWARDDGLVYYSSSAVLSVFNVSSIHSGRYKVQATNMFGRSKLITVHLQVVTEPPSFLQEPPHLLSAAHGTSASVSVLVAGHGVTLEWLDGGRTLLTTAPTPSDSFDGRISRTSYVWPSVSSFDASANITLRASNLLGAVTSRAMQLEVLPSIWHLDCDPPIVYPIVLSGLSAATALIGAHPVVDSAACTPSAATGASQYPPECSARVHSTFFIEPVSANQSITQCGWYQLGNTSSTGRLQSFLDNADNPTRYWAALTFVHSPWLSVSYSAGQQQPPCVLRLTVSAETLTHLRGNVSSCSTTFELPLVQVQLSQSTSARPSPSSSMTGTMTRTSSSTASPTSGWILVPSEEPSVSSTMTSSMTATSSLTPSPTNDPVLALEARVSRMVDSDSTTIFVSGILIGAAIGTAFAWLSHVAVKLRGKQNSRLHPRLVSLISPLAVFAEHASWWSVLSCAQFIVFTDSLAAHYHPAYSRFAASFTPSFMFPPTSLTSIAQWSSTPRDVSHIQQQFNQAHLQLGESVQIDPFATFFDDGFILATFEGGSRLSDEELLLRTITSSLEGVPRLAAHVGIASGDLVLASSIALALFLVALLVAVVPIAYIGYSATVVVTKRYPGTYSTAISWHDILTWAVRVGVTVVVILIPCISLSVMWAWSLQSSQLSIGIGTVVLLGSYALLFVVICGKCAKPVSNRYNAVLPLRLFGTDVQFQWLCAATVSAVLFPGIVCIEKRRSEVQLGVLVSVYVCLSLAFVVHAIKAGGKSDQQKGSSWLHATLYGLQGVILFILICADAKIARGSYTEQMNTIRACATVVIAISTAALIAGAILSIRAWYLGRFASITLARRIAPGLRRAELARKAAGVQMTLRILRVPIPVQSSLLGLDRALLGGAFSTDIVGSICYWVLTQHFISVFMTHEVVPVLVHHDQTKVSSFLPGKPSRVYVTIQPTKRSRYSQSELPSPVTRTSPDRFVYRKPEVRFARVVVDDEAMRFAASLLKSRPARKATNIMLESDISTSTRPQEPLRQNDDDRLGIEPMRPGRPRRTGGHRHGRTQSASYAPHLNPRLPDGFFDFGRADHDHKEVSLAARHQDRVSGGSGATESEDVASPTARPSSPSTPRAAASPEHKHTPSFDELGTKQGYKPMQPRGFFADRRSQRVANAASSSSRPDTLAVDIPVDTARPPARRRSSMTDFILSSVQSLAQAIQTGTGASSAPSSPTRAQARFEGAHRPGLSDDDNEGGDFVHENPMQRQQRKTFSPVAAAAACVSGSRDPLSMTDDRPTSTYVYNPINSDRRGPKEPGWKATHRGRGPHYAYRNQAAAAAASSTSLGSNEHIGTAGPHSLTKRGIEAAMGLSWSGEDAQKRSSLLASAPSPHSQITGVVDDDDFDDSLSTLPHRVGSFARAAASSMPRLGSAPAGLRVIGTRGTTTARPLGRATLTHELVTRSSGSAALGSSGADHGIRVPGSRDHSVTTKQLSALKQYNAGTRSFYKPRSGSGPGSGTGGGAVILGRR